MSSLFSPSLKDFEYCALNTGTDTFTLLLVDFKDGVHRESFHLQVTVLFVDLLQVFVFLIPPNLTYIESL